MITQSYQTRCRSWKPPKKARVAWDFSTLRIKQVKVKLIFETDDAFRKAAPFLTKNPINRPAMSSKIFFVAAVLHFVHPVEKNS